MANMPDAASCFDPAEGGGELLPLSPFYALSYHFGMLLGVADFETEQAYHRAKMRLHNAWLHREGVVWGFDVQLDTERGEVRVLPGLALDAAGHELHLERDACLSVGEWFAAHKDDAELEVEDLDDGAKGFDAHVVVRFKACLTRQVPALSEPCDGAAGTGTAYSRVFETVELLLRPGPAPAPVYPYHRLRLLFSLEPAIEENGSVIESDQEVLDARADILALASEEQPAAYLQAFRRFAALDEIDLRPAESEDGKRLLLFPGDEHEPLVLANLNDIVVQPQNDKWVLAGGEVDVTVRPSHVATSTIQELLCGPLFQAAAAAEAEPAEEDEALVADAGGPRVNRDALELATTSAKLFFTEDLNEFTVQPAAFSVSWLDADGWHPSNVIDADYGFEERSVTLQFETAVEGRVRLIARGTGPAPILGANAVPLAGEKGGPPAGAHDGHDFVHMWEIPV